MRIRHPHIYDNKTTIHVIENIAKKTCMITRQPHIYDNNTTTHVIVV